MATPLFCKSWGFYCEVQTGHRWFTQSYAAAAFSYHDMLCILGSWLTCNQYDKTHSFPSWNTAFVLTRWDMQLKSRPWFPYIRDLGSIVHFKTPRNICADLFVVSAKTSSELDRLACHTGIKQTSPPSCSWEYIFAAADKNPKSCSS